METFFSTSDKVQHIIKSFNLTKTLFVSSIIIGESHTGKKTLAQYLFPKAPLVSGNDQQAVEEALENHDELIITNFEKLSNQNTLDFTNKRIIATADYLGNADLIDDLCPVVTNQRLWLLSPDQQRAGQCQNQPQDDAKRGIDTDHRRLSFC